MAVAAAVPEELFIQVITYVVWDVMVSVAEPETVREASAGRLFLHGGETPFLVMVQEFTFVAFHDTVVVPPLLTRLGTALIKAAGTRTVTVAFAAGDEPRGPVQVIEYVESTAGLTVAVPEVWLPVENPPDAVQNVALVESHVSVEDSPLSIMSGFAERVALTPEHTVGLVPLTPYSESSDATPLILIAPIAAEPHASPLHEQSEFCTTP